MCRVVAYLGRPLSLEDLLYRTDHSLITQVYDVKLHYLLNLAGFGFVAWESGADDYDVPFIYRTPELPMYDRNIQPLARKIDASALLAHVRGVAYDDRQVVAEPNVHPFRYRGTTLALAMNGTLTRFSEMRYDLLPYIRPEFSRQIEGTTDTEWIYAIFLSQIVNPDGPFTREEVETAVHKTLEIIRDVRAARGIETQSGINLLISDGHILIATRYVYDYGWYEDDTAYRTERRRYDFLSLWYTLGSAYTLTNDEWTMTSEDGVESILIASEPITDDTSKWVEAPEYAMLSAAHGEGKEFSVRVREIIL